MSIGINDFISAIAEKLKEVYPDYKVYDDEISQHGYEDCFFVSIIEAGQRPRLLKRRERRYDFDVIFFQRNNSRVEFYSWSNEMMEQFIMLQVDEDLYHVRDLTTKAVDGDFHCMFGVTFDVREIVEEPLMKRLEQEGRLIEHEKS